ncbi:MAG: tRNA-dihydrouridine synthase [Tissierellia bacterium]|nr:tRNA-dihydrouridine synthase [Tissierellia bacterium]
MEERLTLAPLAGYTDMAFRRLCTDYGMTHSTTEMVSAKGLYYKDKKTKDLMAVHPQEAPVALQLFGEDPQVMAYVIEDLSQRDLPFWAFDINMGCPAPKIVKNGAGSALLLDLKRAQDMLRLAVKASRLPVTLKCRKGFYEGQTQALELVKIAEDAGVAMVTIHGRTREDYYRGQADGAFMKKLAASVSIPVLANGDIKSSEDVRDYRGVAQGVAIGRGALGRPFIFEDIKRDLAGLEKKERDLGQCLKIAKTHFLYSLEAKEERQVVLQMRKHFMGYLTGFPGVKALREEVLRLEKKEEVLAWLDGEIEAWTS